MLFSHSTLCQSQPVSDKLTNLFSLHTDILSKGIHHFILQIKRLIFLTLESLIAG